MPLPSVVREEMSTLFILVAAAKPAITLAPKEFDHALMMILPTETKLCCKMLGMATTAIWPSIFQENQTRSPLTRDSTHPPGHHPQGEHAAHALAQKSRPGHTGNPHIKGSHKQHVHRDVCGRGARQKRGTGCDCRPAP